MCRTAGQTTLRATETRPNVQVNAKTLTTFKGGKHVIGEEMIRHTTAPAI